MAQFDTEEIVIGGTEWVTAPFRFNRMLILGGSGESYIDVLLSGVSPLALTNAVGLNYIKALGATKQNGTPTPDNPVDIVCNNGVLKVRNKSVLPLEYQAVEYLESTGIQYIDTGVRLDGTMTIRIKYDYLSAGFVFGSRASTSSRYSGITNENSGVYNIRYGNKVIYSQNTTPSGTVDVVISPNSVVLNGEAVSTTAYGNGFYAGDCFLFTINNSSIPQTGEYAVNRIRRFTIDNVIDLIPCRRKSDNVLGMYDTVTGNFLTNRGANTFIAGADVADTEIYADGTVETVNITGKNLFDKNAILENVRFSNTTGYEYGSTGDIAVQAGRFVSDLIPVQVGSTYTKNTNADAYHRVKIYNSNKICLRYIDNTNTITIQQDEAYIVISGYSTEIDNAQLELGSIATDYEPYFNGGTANAEMLLKVGDYKDNQELLTGTITRNVGIKVLDGTENWIKTSSSRKYCSLSKTEFPNAITTSSDVICSHAIGTGYDNEGYCFLGNNYFNFNYLNSTNDLDDFKQFLAEQYANGTPVIVLYPLATSTTETVTGQTLTASGNCTVTATGSLNNLELELSYKQSI